MTSASSCPRKRWMVAPARRLALAVALLAGFFVAYGSTLSVVLNQAALLSQPGDRLIVVFPPDVPIATALQRLGSAGTVVSGSSGMPWFYQADVVDAAAAETLSESGWVMRIPQQPTLQGCFSMLTERR
jgi:hypothetical protein